ncbi:hypothetical protein B566_EDAN018735 [Ephemera danica]|nr:hypothetical protein B566_EDAN018735 [Ephemera danica]
MGMPTTYVQATPDILMGDLLKNMRSSQIFSVCGQPDVQVAKVPAPEGAPKNEHFYQARLQGLDVFDPVTMDLDTRSGLDVPAWFLDTDYNGMVFRVAQAFFPRTQAWDNLKRALKADFDDSVWAHLAGDTSTPFTAGVHGQIAVKDLGAIKGEFELAPARLTVLSGGNNTGKTYAMYALWGLYQRRARHVFAFAERLAEQLKAEGSVEIGLEDFCKQHWSTVERGISDGLRKRLGELFSAPQAMFAQAQASPRNDVAPEHLRAAPPRLAYVPPMTGLSIDEPVYQRPKIEQLLGLGKPGEVIRNLLLITHQDTPAWQRLTDVIRRLFNFELAPPDGAGADIVAEYQRVAEPGAVRPRLDIASAGSGFQQVLLLMTFLHAKPGSILLLDEPDAHLHVILQDAIYHELKSVAERDGSQLIVATHSEVIIDAVEPTELFVVLNEPRQLADNEERRALIRSLKVLDNADEWKAQGTDPRPPVFIAVCKNTRLAKLMYEWLAEDKPPPGIPNAGLADFRNRGDVVNTIRVDSTVMSETDSGEAKSDLNAWMRVTLDTVGRLDWPRDRQGSSIHPEGFVALAKKLGKPLSPPGRDVRAIISVGMLTEGWDCNTVTHIVGLRPFMSQLLCEQVVGRGLRRASYETEGEADDERLGEEVAQVFGVPFQVVPFKANQGGVPKPPVKTWRVRALPERADLEIRFPRVEGFAFEPASEVRMEDWDRVPNLTIDPSQIPSEVQMKAGLPTNQGRPTLYGPGKVDLATLAAYRQAHRLQTRVAEAAREMVKAYVAGSANDYPAPHPSVLYPQFVKLIQYFVKHKVMAPLPATKADVFLSPYYGWMFERLLAGLRPAAGGRERVRLEQHRGPGTTADVEYATRKEPFAVMKSHVNFVVPDSQWERIAAYALDTHPKFMGKSITFGQVDELSRALAAYFQSLGLERGDRVAIMLPNMPQYPVAVAAILRAGYVVVNVNPQYTPRELEHQLKDSGAKAIVIVELFAHTLQQVLSHVPTKHIVLAAMGDMLGFLKGAIVNHVVRNVKKMVPAFDLPGSVRFNDAIAQGTRKTLKPATTTGNDIAVLQYTGGTTGVSKGAVLLHRNLVANVLQAEAWYQPALQRIPAGEQIVTVCALPLYHIFGFTANMMLSMRMGGCNLLIVNARDFPALLKDLAGTRFHSFPAVNTLFNALANHPDFNKVDWSHLKISVGGGMAVTSGTAKQWLEKTGCPVCEGYGLSETSPSASCNPVDATAYSGNIGLPMPNTEFTLLDDDGQEVAIGQPGEIAIRGPQVMAGYWQRPDETAKVMTADGYFRTGDIGIVDERGYFKIVDRKKDMILVSGFNVYPNEVEDVLSSMPGVMECAAVGVPDENHFLGAGRWHPGRRAGAEPGLVHKECLAAALHGFVPGAHARGRAGAAGDEPHPVSATAHGSATGGARPAFEGVGRAAHLHRVMNLLMAATPIAMEQCKHPFSAAALVLEWHVLGMFVPSFFTGSLIKRFGALPVMTAGLALNFACVAFALTGTELMNFLGALLALGVGWNFLYIGGSTLLTTTYRPEEKTTAQAAMDFCVYATMTVTSFSSGALVTTGGWQFMNYGSIVPLLILTCALAWLAMRNRASPQSPLQS